MQSSIMITERHWIIQAIAYATKELIRAEIVGQFYAPGATASMPRGGGIGASPILVIISPIPSLSVMKSINFIFAPHVHVSGQTPNVLRRSSAHAIVYSAGARQPEDFMLTTILSSSGDDARIASKGIGRTTLSLF